MPCHPIIHRRHGQARGPLRRRSVRDPGPAMRPRAGDSGRGSIPARTVRPILEAPVRRGTWDVLRLTVRLGVSLLLTSGLAGALTVYASRSLGDPVTMEACSWFFGFCLALVGPGGRL
jgi:hypothetical protein